MVTDENNQIKQRITVLTGVHGKSDGRNWFFRKEGEEGKDEKELYNSNEQMELDAKWSFRTNLHEPDFYCDSFETSIEMIEYLEKGNVDVGNFKFELLDIADHTSNQIVELLRSGDIERDCQLRII